MKHVLIVLMAVLLTACGSSSDDFKIDARFLNMNQADFYLYSPDGVISGIDTVHVMGGRFTYERPVMKAGTLVIVFPNFSIMPVFVTPGATVDIDANAAKLKEMKIEGTKENEDFTEWRLNTLSQSPDELRKQAVQWVEDHPESSVSRWLVRQYLILSPKPDYAKARKLLRAMQKATDNNVDVTKMLGELSNTEIVGVGSKLPKFRAYDIDGRVVSDTELNKGKTIVCVWTSWNYDSQSALRQLANVQRNDDSERKADHVLTVSLDPSVAECRKTLDRCNAENLVTVCDTMMWNSPLVSALGITSVPYNLVLENGKVTKRCVPSHELTK